ncbi:MAG: glycerophosphoryl diester phosphodiesterase membrane domain-containing protein [Terracidiphilus sp.]|jgi:hypothetical protein
MESNLRPLTLGEILDRTAQLYRTNFLLFAGIASVYAGALLVLGLLQLGAEELLRVLHRMQYLPWVTGGWFLVSLPLMMIFAGAAVAANNRAVSWVHLGQPATIRGAYSSILPRLGRYLWLMTIVAFVIYTPFALICGGYFGGLFMIRPIGAKGAPGDSGAVGMVLLISAVFLVLLVAWMAYAIIMGLRYSLAIPACVVEEIKAREAIRRSIDLSQGARGRIFVLGLLIVVIEIGLLAVAYLFFIVAAVKSHGVLPLWARVLQQFVGFLTNSFIGPIYATGLTLFYYDQRVRKEGFDIEWMMQAAGLTPQPSAVETTAAPASAAEPGLALDAQFDPPPAAAQDPPLPDSGTEHE